MLTLNATIAIGGCWANGETRTLLQTSPCDIPRVNFLISAAAHSSLRSSCKQTLHLLSSFSKCSRSKSHYQSRKSNRRTVTQLVRHAHICASSDDEYRSSRNIAVSLFRRYRNVSDRGGAENLKEFISAGVNAYALGCTDEGLRKELKNLMDSGVDIEEIQTYGGSTSLRSKISSEECICLASFIVYVRISWIMPLAFPQPCHRATMRLRFRLPFHGHAAKLPCDWDLPTNCGIPACLWGSPSVAVTTVPSGWIALHFTASCLYL